MFVSSGTVTVNEDSSVQVLAEEAHPIESLDLGACREILSGANSQLSSASTDVVSIMIKKANKLVLNINISKGVCT